MYDTCESAQGGIQLLGSVPAPVVMGKNQEVEWKQKVGCFAFLSFELSSSDLHFPVS